MGTLQIRQRNPSQTKLRHDAEEASNRAGRAAAVHGTRVTADEEARRHMKRTSDDILERVGEAKRRFVPDVIGVRKKASDLPVLGRRAGSSNMFKPQVSGVAVAAGGQPAAKPESTGFYQNTWNYGYNKDRLKATRHRRRR